MATPSASPVTFSTTLSASDPSMTAQATAADNYREFILAAAQQFGFQPAVICGVGSRESGWGLLLKPPGPAGTGDFAPRHNTKPWRSGPMPPDGQGYGRGLMQIDFDAFDFARTGHWQDPASNINAGAQVLHNNIRFFTNNSSLQGLELLRVAIAAYNCGAGNVQKALQQSLDVDAFTAHANYSADVLNRAGFFQLHGWS